MAVILEKNGRKYEFGDPSINKQRINDLLSVGFEVSEGELPEGITLPDLDLPEANNESQEELGLSTSLPAVNKEDIEAQTKAQFDPVRKQLESEFGRVISETEAKGVQEEKALGGQLGAGRRFSSSAQAFIKFIGEENQKKVNNLIAQKNQALADFDFKLAEAIQGRIKDEQDQAQQEFQNSLAILDRARKEIDTTGATLADKAVSDFLKEGITDKNDMFQEAINKGINISSQDINDSLTNLLTKESTDKTKNSFKFDNASLGQLLSIGFSGEDVQTIQDTVNSNGLYGKNENGISLSEALTKEEFSAVKNILYPPQKDKASEGLESSSFITQSVRIGHMLFGKGRAFGEGDKQTAQDLVKGYLSETGMSLDEFKKGGIYNLVDEYTGFTITRNKPLAEGLRTVMLNISGEKGFSDYDTEGVARLINSGNDMEAIRKVENVALSEYQKQFGKTDMVTEDDIKYVYDQVQEINKLIGEGALDNIGAFTGSIDNFLARKFGFGQSVKIMAKVNSLTAELINKRAGSNITDNEWERIIAPSVPQKNESARTFKDKLEELVNNPLIRLNAQRSQVSLPQLNINNISIPESRIDNYVSSSYKEFDDFLGSYDEYNGNVWE